MKRLLFAIAATAALGLASIAPAIADTKAVALASGPAYSGAPDVNVTAAFYGAGGGPGGFSIVRAVASMVGDDTLQSEMVKLAGTYGQSNADLFPHVFDYAMADAWTRAGRDNVLIPPFGSHEGPALAHDLIRDGTAPDGTFWTGYLLDRTLTPKVHAQVAGDIASRYGTTEAITFDRMSNQFFFDLSQDIGTNVALAPNH